MGFLGNEVPSHQPASAVSAHHDEELFESLEEIEAQTIENFLPDEDDLFSGMIDELGCSSAHANNGDVFEEHDLFSSGGGMELEGDDHIYMGQRNVDYIRGLSNGHVGSNSSIVGEHPSRTLFVRNVNSNVEESELKAFFEVHVTLLLLGVLLGFHPAESWKVQLTTVFCSVSNMEIFERCILPARIVDLL